MLITIFGVIWLLVIVVLLFYPTKNFVYLLIFASIFQATSVVNLLGRGIQPFFITELFFILKFASIKNNYKKQNVDTIFKILLLFLFISYITTAVCPKLFHGIKVFPGNDGIDDNFITGGSPLSYSLSNLIQPLYLTIHTITLFCIYLIRRKVERKYIWRSILIAIITFICIGFWQYAYLYFPTVPFPSEFLYNNIISRQTTEFLTTSDFGLRRMNSTFTEPSIAGVFIAASFWALFSQKGIKYKFLCLLLLLCLGFNLSSTGIVTFLIGAFIYALLFQNKILVVMVFILFIVYYLITTLDSLSIINRLVFNKLNTASGINRTGADIFSWDLFLKTYGLGVGLGSHRTSSFLFNLLSNVGIAGTIIWGAFIYKVLKPLNKLKHDPLSLFVLIFSLVLICGQIIGVSEINFGLMWMWIFTAVIIRRNVRKIKKNQTHASI